MKEPNIIKIGQLTKNLIRSYRSDLYKTNENSSDWKSKIVATVVILFFHKLSWAQMSNPGYHVPLMLFVCLEVLLPS